MSPADATAELTAEEAKVLRCGEIGFDTIRALLARYGLSLQVIEDGRPIPGSYWGAPEAGLIGTTVAIRADTPVHSFLHETCHTICMDTARRDRLHTEAADGVEDIASHLEENGVCYLEILLADHLDGAGRDRLMLDMDRWGYSFRLGSTRAWFENDADDAQRWLIDRELIAPNGAVTFRLRD
ncbi:MAG: hypothetical protein AAGE94_09500 [Acidobacteriota bacterium]